MDAKCTPTAIPPNNGQADHAAPPASPAAPRPRLTIQRSSGIYLVLSGQRPTALERRFAALFRETWRMIPLGARRAMVKHWRDNPSGQAPFIMLVDVATPYAHAMAACTRSGDCLRFEQATIDAMPDDAARALIAHELAHVYQWATGTSDELTEGGSILGPNTPVEDDACRIQAEWGLDDGPIVKFEQVRALAAYFKRQREKRRNQRKKRRG